MKFVTRVNKKKSRCSLKIFAYELLIKILSDHMIEMKIKKSLEIIIT